ncbi:MAG: GH3 auxin-responsive promoter family protein [Bacteroidetes bacterium]|nr:MAG: GH3 auxin-responsive promoter family protein [Bacteroidota bacterium]
MPLLNSFASWLMTKRMHQIELFMKYPHEVQNEWFRKLIESAKDTEWGKKFDYASIENPVKFAEQVPLQDYDSIKPYIERIRRGEQNILWNTETKWFAKSSGTTSDKSKFIPVSNESLEECHYKGGKDMISIYCSNYPETELFTGKNLALGGSHSTDIFGNYESYNGDVSAIIMKNLPLWAEFFRAPDLSIALLTNFEEKLEKMARATMAENVTSIAGVPSWMNVLLKRILEISGKKTIREVWPNLEVYFHGGVNFSPYKENFKQLFGKGNTHYFELYNASEGFFGLQDQKKSSELLLMLDYGIYYEFIPVDDLNDKSEKTIPLHEIKTGHNYAMVISTNGGLWRYQIGDTIKFTSANPYRFKITGRTKHFLNAFGEEVIIDNTEKALKIACEKSNALVSEYTVAPVYMNGNKNGAHEWLIEFEKAPQDLNYFAEVLDNALKSLNSDYEAKRFNNFVLRAPIIRQMKNGTFYDWLKTKDKLGGQNKIPRLSNDRTFVDEIVKRING